MAFFGAPMPRRTTRCARCTRRDQIRTEQEDVEPRARGAGATGARVRIAINSGPVVVGDVGSARASTTRCSATRSTSRPASRAFGGDPGDIVIGARRTDCSRARSRRVARSAPAQGAAAADRGLPRPARRANRLTVAGRLRFRPLVTGNPGKLAEARRIVAAAHPGLPDARGRARPAGDPVAGHSPDPAGQGGGGLGGASVGRWWSRRPVSIWRRWPDSPGPWSSGCSRQSRPRGLLAGRGARRRSRRRALRAALKERAREVIGGDGATHGRLVLPGRGSGASDGIRSSSRRARA